MSTKDPNDGYSDEVRFIADREQACKVFGWGGAILCVVALLLDEAVNTEAVGFMQGICVTLGVVCLIMCGLISRNEYPKKRD